jgi:eukaryotic-like serine/threonine-protein kinase
MVVTDLKDRVLNNRYHLMHSIGQGGMALVFEAHDNLLQRDIAIKLLRKNYSGNPGFRDRFLQEARSAANLSHPNIVSVYDFGIDSGEIYIVMELANGADLKTTIQTGQVFSLSDSLDIGIQVCNGLGYAHRAGIVHCDVKPQNMIITKDKVVKITDFGIARAMSASFDTEFNEMVWGSPQYMAPEIIKGAIPTPQADVYSIGAVLYELFTGNPPFDGKDVDEVLNNQKSLLPTPIRSKIPGFPEELDLVVMKVLSKEPSQRYRSADQLGNVLATVKHHLGLSYGETLKGKIPPLPPFPTPVPISYEDSPNKKQKGTFDLAIISLELLCLLMVGGLIPFWLFVFYFIRPLFK